MGLKQLNFAGLDRVQVALIRLKEFEPPEGYYLAFSGGKDSITLYDLAVKSGVKFDAHYSMPGIDPPELVRFIRDNYPNVKMHKPAISIFREVVKKGLPRRQARWCCEALKEQAGDNRRVVTGIRWAESSRRKQRKMLEICRTKSTKTFLHPLIDWEDEDVWEYIRNNNIKYCSLYDEGWKRLGCILCPMKSSGMAQKEMARWPKTAEAWKRATIRLWERGTEGTKKFPSGESLFDWWISRRSHNTDNAQCIMFE